MPLSSAELQAIQSNFFADDIPIPPGMQQWEAKQVEEYFETAGAIMPCSPPPRLPPGKSSRSQLDATTSSSTVASSMGGMRLADVERLSSRVVVVRGLNPGFFTGPGTNTYIVGCGAERTLIDAGDAGVPGYVRLLERTLRDECGGARLSHILITHSHPDHVGGARAVAAACGAPGRAVSFLKVPWSGHDAGLPIEAIPDGYVLQVDASTTLRAHFTPGHAPDHTCWSLDEEGSLFSGDTILGAGTVIVPAHGGSMQHYLASLRQLRAAREPWRVIYPGHGPPIRAPRAQQAIDEYIAHREEREAQIVRHLQALGRGAGPLPVLLPVSATARSSSSASELVGALYRDRPLTFELRQAAAETVFSHLVFLRAKGEVETPDGPHANLGSRWRAVDAVASEAVAVT